MGLLFTIAAGPLQRSHSQIRVPRDSWSHFSASDARLLLPGVPGSLIYILQEHCGLVIASATRFSFRRLLRLAGLRWRYSNSPPHGVLVKVKSKSKSHCDWRSISKSWCRVPSGTHDQIFITLWHLRSCFSGAPSLRRGRVCRLYMLLALASVVFLGSESLGIREHNLLS
jgi:hypothetical protein